jgi:hypothetical protein
MGWKEGCQVTQRAKRGVKRACKRRDGREGGRGERGCCRGSSSSVRIGLMKQISIKTPNPKCRLSLKIHQ